MFTRRYRRRRYPKLLLQHSLTAMSPRERIYNLAQIWRRVNRGDFNELDWKVTSARTVVTTLGCLPSLVLALDHHNSLSASDSWDAVDTLNKQLRPATTVTLDTYLSTPDMMVIDVEQHLRRLASLIQILSCECEQYYHDQKSEYPARAAGYLIPDLVAFTTTLLKVEESMP